MIKAMESRKFKWEKKRAEKRGKAKCHHVMDEKKCRTSLQNESAQEKQGNA